MPGLSDSARRALGSGAARSRSPPRPAAGQDVETFFNAFLSGYLLGRYGGSADAARRLWRIMVELERQAGLNLGDREFLRAPLRLVRDRAGAAEGAQAQEYDELPPHSEAARLLDLLVALGRECTRRGPHAHNIAEELRHRMFLCVVGKTWRKRPALRMGALRRMFALAREEAASRGTNCGIESISFHSPDRGAGAPGSLRRTVSVPLGSSPPGGGRSGSLVQPRAGGPPMHSWAAALAAVGRESQGDLLYPLLEQLLVRVDELKAAGADEALREAVPSNSSAPQEHATVPPRSLCLTPDSSELQREVLLATGASGSAVSGWVSFDEVPSTRSHSVPELPTPAMCLQRSRSSSERSETARPVSAAAAAAAGTLYGVAAEPTPTDWVSFDDDAGGSGDAGDALAALLGI